MANLTDEILKHAKHSKQSTLGSLLIFSDPDSKFD